jgi:hypothetical protein
VKMEIKFDCTGCGGTGIRTYINNDHQTVIENPCSICNGSKIMSSKRGGIIDDTEIVATLEDILNKVTHIKNKVNDIWDKVK